MASIPASFRDLEADLDLNAVSCISDADDFVGEVIIGEPLLDALDAESPVCAVDDFCIDLTGETATILVRLLLLTLPMAPSTPRCGTCLIVLVKTSCLRSG